MPSSFLARRSLMGIPNALAILLVVFFLVPFAFRGARLSLERTENNVKDWLPDDFRETSELAWFGDYFVGERFIVATWPGCTEEDQRLTLFEAKLRRETEGGTLPANLPDAPRARQLGSELRLLLPPDIHRDWGGRDEKWLISEAGLWYFITPDGRLYRWAGRNDAMGLVGRSIRRLFSQPPVEGQFIAAFGGGEGRVANPYYNDLTLLTAPLFKTVQTGPDVVNTLAAEGGPLWPRELMDDNRRRIEARRRATEQLTGALFAPAVPPDFDWQLESFLEAMPEKSRERLTEVDRERIELQVARILNEHYDGQLDRLRRAPSDEQATHWYTVFDALTVPPPPRQTCVMVTLTQLGSDNLAYVLGRGMLGGPRGRLLRLADDSGLDTPQPPSAAPPPFDRFDQEVMTESSLHLGGPPVDNLAIDEEGTITLARLIGYSAMVGLLLSYLCFRSIKITIMVFFVGAVAAATSLSIVWWSGAGVDAILMSMPSLVYVLGLSGAIHVVNYYRDEVHSRGVEGAPQRALGHALVPCSLAAITTAIGLMSLYTSNILPIRKFGFFSAVGVIATLALLFAYLPSALETFVPRLRQRKVATPGFHLANFWEGVGRWIVNHYRLVAIGSLILFVAAGAGLTKIQTSVQLLKLFDSDARIIRDYAWLEEHFAKLVPMELVLRVPPAMQANGRNAGNVNNAGDAGDGQATARYPLRPLERAQAVDRVRKTVELAFGERGQGITGPSMSALTFLPPLPGPSSAAIDPARDGLNRELAAAMQEDLFETDHYRIEADGAWEGSELWRISLRVGALTDVDYGRFIYDLREVVEPVLEAYRVREEVLAAVERHRGQGHGQVLLLGRPRPQRVGVEPVLRPGVQRTAEVDTSSGMIDTQAIFASTLNELLDNERLRPSRWHDPAGGRLPEGWGRILAATTCVVLVHDDPAYDLDFIRQHAREVIDARLAGKQQSVPVIVDGVPAVEQGGPLQVVYTGVVPVVYKAQRTLLYSLVESIGWAFVLIAGVMLLLLNPGRFPRGYLTPRNLLWGAGAAAVSMIPNVFPVTVIFGMMGHLGVLIDIGTMMTASVAMGVAVDDTIHFLSWFRHGLNSGLDRREAVIETYRRVGPAMTQTTLVGGLGLFVFALSTFTPTQRFGTLMLVLLFAALVGDLVFLPALLASPLGRLFRPREGGVPRTEISPHAIEAAGDDLAPGALPREASGAEGNGEESRSSRGSPSGVSSPPHLRPDAVHRPDPAHRPRARRSDER